MYSTDFIDNSTNLFMYIEGFNDITGGYLMTIFLVILYIILIMIFKKYDTKAVMFFASLVVTIISWLLYFAGMVSLSIAWIFIALFIVSATALIFWRE